MQKTIPSSVETKYLIATCRSCGKPHFEDETYERDGALRCRRTGFAVERMESPVPIRIYRFVWYRITIKRHVILSGGRLRASTTFTLRDPQIVDGHLRVETPQYGVVLIPMDAVRMEPCSAPVEVK